MQIENKIKSEKWKFFLHLKIFCEIIKIFFKKIK